MTLPPGERANHSVWGAEKGTFEIWFFVVFDPGSNRAFWIRYEATHLLEQGQASRVGMVWASAFERSGGGATPSVVSAKRIVPLEDCEIARDRFHVRIGEARLSPGRLTGEVGSGAGRIAWSLTYEPAARPSIRSPAWLDRVPLPMHGVHPNTEVPFSGWVEVGSLRHELSSARGTQEHLFGKERPDEIRWVYATGLDGDPAAYFELAQVRPRKALPALVFASMSTPRASVDATALRSVPRARVVAGNGWLSGRAEGGDRSIIVAAHAARDSFAGYVYRDPRGHDLYVAQSDLAHVEVEVFGKAPLGRRRPIHRTIAPGGALELHQPTPLEGIRYLPWPSETAAEAPDAEPEVGGAAAPPPLPKDGELLPLPVPTRMFAAGLTYVDHVTETGSGAEPVMFEKSVRAWLGDGEIVTRPDDASVRDALDAVEPGLGSALLDRWGFIPALLDYEVEIGLYLLADIEPRDLARDRAPSVGYFVANDLTHRTCQILGEGSRDPMAFWSASKSFPGFCPVTKTMWVPSRPCLDSLPEVTLSTFVRGERRQQARSTALAVPVRALLSAAMKRAGRGLRAGEVVLTGTPSGIALKVPAWKRALGRRFLDRFARAEAAFGLYASAPEAFLTAGAVVTVEAGFLGRRTIVVA